VPNAAGYITPTKLVFAIEQNKLPPRRKKYLRCLHYLHTLVSLSVDLRSCGGDDNPHFLTEGLWRDSKEDRLKGGNSMLSNSGKFLKR
jgi:hypothetical protein